MSVHRDKFAGGASKSLASATLRAISSSCGIDVHAVRRLSREIRHNRASGGGMIEYQDVARMTG
jgi:hypothetical protein